MEDKDLYSEIVSIIAEETIYMRHHIGKIVDLNDPLKRGRIKITLPELGLSAPAQAIWCNPRQGQSMIHPKVGKWAEVYFINGDRTRPVYLFPATEIEGNMPKSYDGSLKKNVLFENAEDSSVSIVEEKGVFTINEGEDFATMFNKMKTAFDQLKTDLNNLVSTFNAHTNSTYGLSSTPAVASSADMSNAKAEKVKI